MAKYFTLSELTRSQEAARRGLDNTPSPQARQNLVTLINNLLDPLREMWGAPITVNSGFRSPMLNYAVGGVSTPGNISQHVKGEAADITAGNPTANKHLFDMILRSGLEFDQLIDEHNYAWLHISYSTGKNRKQILHL